MRIAMFICLVLPLYLKSQNFQTENGALVLPAPIEFESGTDKIKPESKQSLEHIKNYLTEKTYITTIRIEGHTAAGENESANQDLSEKRALAVGDWLVQNGVDCLRILCVGFGSSKPIQSNETPEGRSANSRITVVNAALKGKMIGGMPADGGGIVAGDTCR